MSDKCPRVMLLELSMSVEAEYHKFKYKKIGGCGIRKKLAYQTASACPSSLTEVNSHRLYQLLQA